MKKISFILTLFLSIISLNSCQISPDKEFIEYMNKNTDYLENIEVISIGEIIDVANVYTVDPSIISLNLSKYSYELSIKVNDYLNNNISKEELRENYNFYEEKFKDLTKNCNEVEFVINDNNYFSNHDILGVIKGRLVKYRLNGKLENDVIIYKDGKIYSTYKEYRKLYESIFESLKSYVESETQALILTL